MDEAKSADSGLGLVSLDSVSSMTVVSGQREIAFSPSCRFFAVFGKGFRTAIYESRTMKRLIRHKSVAKLIAFQYDTGLLAIVPLTHDNKVVIWDFKYDRVVREIDFVQPIVQLGYMRNLLIVASNERLVMNDLAQGENTVYLPLTEGSKVFFNGFYERLRVGYFRRPSHFVNMSLWDGQKSKLEEISYTKGKFDYLGETMILFAEDGILVHRERLLTNRIKYNPEEFIECLFDTSGLKPSTGLILVLDRNDNIVVQWYPIFRLSKNNEKPMNVSYRLKYEQILEEDADLSQNTLVYLRDDNLYVSRPGSLCQVYGRYESSD